MTMSKSFVARNVGVAGQGLLVGGKGAPATAARTTRTIDGKVFGLANGKSFELYSSYPFIYLYIPTYIFLYVLVFSSCCPCSNFKPLLKCESKVRRESKSSSTSRMTATIDSKTNDCHCQVCASTFEPVPGHQFCVKVRPHFTDFPLSTSISTPLENRCQAVSPRSPFKLNC